jgi:methylated-DNA-protein-cysteine methyltransferase related protein
VTGFRDLVLSLVRAIPPGRVATYGQIARLAGHPRAARQVGGVLYGLRAGEDVPWQRVVNAAGGLSTYRVGSGELQRALLEREGVAFGPDGRLDLSRYRWQPDDAREAGL